STHARHRVPRSGPAPSAAPERSLPPSDPADPVGRAQLAWLSFMQAPRLLVTSRRRPRAAAYFP
ncbi:hypothetical protein ACFXD5_42140, partial [Streptomyces sp. NPDC059385]|uniref:hypothetical protein n=1 Tax=Streptomyces sp. NPDC059385 TaxID=3346817 RepID=UPI00367ECFD2